MNLYKFLSIGALTFALGLSSCVGDLDLKPNDPNLVDTSAPDFNDNALAICYSGLACSGINGAESSYINISGLDAGTSAYGRLMFYLSEFCSDELVWIWPDSGVSDITGCSWSSTNTLITGAYYRLLGHIAICNQFLTNTAGNNSAQIQEMRAEARVLRALSYYNMIDLFGQSSFITEEAEVGANPEQKSRKEVFDWIESELLDIVDNRLIDTTPVLGRVGLDGAEGLLARLYLNAEIFSGEERWADCLKRCDNIISRHQSGPLGNGLAENYLYLFCKDNIQYLPGGSNSAQNEILFGIYFDSEMTQSYGGPSFLISSTMANTHYLVPTAYGAGDPWMCIRGKLEMANRFPKDQVDDRDDLWLRGGTDVFPGGIDPYTGDEYKAEDYQDRFVGFTGDWLTTGGNDMIKFTNRTIGDGIDGWDYYKNADGTYTYGFESTKFSSTAQPLIRLADIYLMWAECYVNSNGAVGNSADALKYVNYVRERAHATPFTVANLNIKDLMDERSRELYMESVRRTDLVRNSMFAGTGQTVWQCKGTYTNLDGTRIPAKYNLYPIPSAVISAQPEFKQNPGY